MFNTKKYVVAFIIWNVLFFSFDAWMDSQIDAGQFEEYLDEHFGPPGLEASFGTDFLGSFYMLLLTCFPPVLFCIEPYEDENVQKKEKKTDGC